jgi:hypothetical protein
MAIGVPGLWLQQDVRGPRRAPRVMRRDWKSPSARKRYPASEPGYNSGQAAITLARSNRPRMTSQSSWPSALSARSAASNFQITWLTFMPQLPLTNILVAPRLPVPRAELSSPGESHPEALPELYVSVSAHTAPMVKNRLRWCSQSASRLG